MKELKELSASLLILATTCLLATSCATSPRTPQYVNVTCSVQVPTVAPKDYAQAQYELRVDGALVASGIAGRERYTHDVPLLPGEHTVEVVSDGYKTWSRKVAVLQGAKNQGFRILLEKTEGN